MLLSLLVYLASAAVIPIARSNVLWTCDPKDPCDTEECNAYAQKILNSMDPTVDPCTDFYKYACGSWGEHNPIPPDEVSWSEFDITKQKTSDRLLTMMMEPEKPNDLEAVKKALRFFRSCMDTDEIERNGITLLNEIVNSLGGWPIAMPADDWNSDEHVWYLIENHYFGMLGSRAIIGISFIPNDENSSIFTISVDEYRTFPFIESEKNLVAQSASNTYLDAIVQTAKIFAQANGYNVSPDEILKDATDMIHLEIILQQLTKIERQYEINGTLHEKMTIGELQQFYDSTPNMTAKAQINWLQIIKLAFITVEDVEITSDTEIYVSCKMCITALAQLFSYSRTRVLVNYIQWMFISTHMEYCTQQLQDIRFNVLYGSYNITEQRPRWEVCIDDVPLKDAMSYLFIYKYFVDQVFLEAVDMTDRVQEELKKYVRQIEWADDTMKQYMIDKLDHVRKEIGYPGWYKNMTAMNNLYKDINVTSDYLKNILVYTKSQVEMQLQYLSTGYPKDTWLDYPTTVNAFFYGPANTILLPAAQLQDPYFLYNIPNAINYGHVGFIVGHELSHALDTDGIRYDKDGNRFSGTLDSILTHYEQRAQCFVDQYSNYTLDETDENGEPINLDGKQTQAENIADTLGIEVTFAAYRNKNASDHSTPIALKNLPNVDDTKLFFLSFASRWCKEERKSNDPGSYTNDHSPANLRVNGVLSNNVAFSEAYNCPVGSPMNRQAKCSIWN